MGSGSMSGLLPRENGRALVNGQPERHLGAVCHTRYELLNGKRLWEAVGQDYIFAKAKRKMREPIGCWSRGDFRSDVVALIRYSIGQ